MPIAAKLDEWGLPAWIALMILSFWVFWPLGLVVLAFLIGSGRMGCGHHRMERWQNKMERMQAKVDRMRGYMEQGGAGRGGWWGWPAVERQPRLRRLPRRDLAAARRRAARIPRIPRAPALRQGPDRIRAVHVRAPRPQRSGRPRRSDAATAELNDDLSKHDLSRFDGPSAFTRGRPVSVWEAAAGGRAAGTGNPALTTSSAC